MDFKSFLNESYKTSITKDKVLDILKNNNEIIFIDSNDEDWNNVFLVENENHIHIVSGYIDDGYQTYNPKFKSWSFVFDPQEPLPVSIKDHLVDLCELKRIIT